MRNRIARVLTPLPLLAALLAPAACGGAATGCLSGPTSTAVTVLASWTGQDQDNFQKVRDAFTRKCHIPTVYEGTRAVDQVLRADISRGSPPDVVILPSAGALREYATAGLVPIDDDLSGVDPYAPMWTQLTTVGGHRYAVVVKAAIKSLLWYSPRLIRRFWSSPMPTDWTQLTDLANTISAHGAAPWCMGTGSTSESGWPGTDWIEDIVLHEYGTGVYEQWANGILPWTDPRIVNAWGQWTALFTGVPGGPTSALFTDSGDVDPMTYGNPPTCYLNHEAYVGNLGKLHIQPVTGYDYFAFPSMGTAGGTEVAGDLAGAFNDNPGTRAFIQFLASQDGQLAWPPGSGSLSIDGTLAKDRTIYPDPITQSLAAVITGQGTECFDASDLMPSTLSAAFEQAVLAVLGDPQRYVSQPNGLNSLLHSLDTARVNTYQGRTTNFHCGR